jgi:hypothetical protein
MGGATAGVRGATQVVGTPARNKANLALSK